MDEMQIVSAVEIDDLLPMRLHVRPAHLTATAAVTGQRSEAGQMVLFANDVLKSRAFPSQTSTNRDLPCSRSVPTLDAAGTRYRNGRVQSVDERVLPEYPR